MIEYKGFTGIMDSDNAPSGVARGMHMMANNGVFRGVNGLLRFQNVVGNREIVFTKPAGTNECCGAFYSHVDSMLYWCNWNSNNHHGIYQIYIPTLTVTTILESNVNTDGDILNFDLNNPVHSMNIMYGSDGNFLYFVDSLGRPTEIDLNRLINNPYTITKRAFIDVAKAPPIMPPEVSYENDLTATVNNLKNALFQFRYRYIYNNNEKSVFSSGSEVPLPYMPFDQAISSVATNNSRICVYVQTGDVNVKAIELAFRKMQDGVMSNWLKVERLNKVDLNIPDNDIYRYLFKNDSAYPTLPTEGTDPNTQVLNLQDLVPKKANTQALLNGNVIGYAGITEGFDKVVANMTIDTTQTSLSIPNNTNGILFFANQSGNNITIYLAGVGANNFTTNEPDRILRSAYTTFKISAQTSAYVNKDFQYYTTNVDETVSSILNSLSAAAQAQGFTQVAIGANTLTLSMPDLVLLASMSWSTTYIDLEAVYVNAPRSKYAYGVQYFDSAGRTNGVTYGASYFTQPTATLAVAGRLLIWHRPPEWAAYYHVVRTKNMTYQKRLEWVSDAAFTEVNSITNQTYSYIGIRSIYEYNQDFNTTSGVIGYEFQKGDRVRFVARFDINSVYDASGYDTGNYDYEILGTVENPVKDGVIMKGTYLKIAAPPDNLPHFSLNSDENFQNYHIVLYNIIAREGVKFQLFYEFGQQYMIGNAGTTNAYHMGMLGTQSTDLSAPAIIPLDKGDYFYRRRKIVTGVKNNVLVGSNGFSDRYATAKTQYDNEVSNVAYSLQNNAAQSAGISTGSYPTFVTEPAYSSPQTGDYLYYNRTANSVNVRIKGDLAIASDHPSVFAVYVKQATSSGTICTGSKQLYTLIEGINVGTDGATSMVNMSIDEIVSVCPNSQIWLLFENRLDVVDIHVAASSFEITVLKDITIPIVEESYWDLSYIDLDANSRVTVIDENAAEIYYPTRFRWGLAYLQDTNINDVNRFYAANYDEWDRSKGDVRRLVARGRLLKIFQSKGTGRVGIYTKFVTDNTGAQILTLTQDIIARNNIYYYEGEYGIGNYPTSLVSTETLDAFVDHIRGCQIISDNAGLRSISELYLGQYFLSSLLLNYNKTYVRPNGSIAKIMGIYNYIEEEYHCILQGGTNQMGTINDLNFSFNMTRKGYTGFFDWHPEWVANVEEKIYSWKDGRLYIHDNATNYCNFYGVQYDCNLTVPFNTPQMEKKGWRGMSQQGNTVWFCPLIYTQTMSYGTTPQSSNLVAGDFKTKEGMFHASFLRDVNSVNGLNNGDKLKGTYIVLKLQPVSSTGLVYLTAMSVKYLDSALTLA